MKKYVNLYEEDRVTFIERFLAMAEEVATYVHISYFSQVSSMLIHRSSLGTEEHWILLGIDTDRFLAQKPSREQATYFLKLLADDTRLRIIEALSERSYYANELAKKLDLTFVYQDFARYSITMEENIAIGDMNRLAIGGSNERIDEAVRRVGLQDVEMRLPQGRRTPLGKIRDEGVDLSGGEWQRLAMARAFVNPAPLRLLDEPTAALDPLSESKLYQDLRRSAPARRRSSSAIGSDRRSSPIISSLSATAGCLRKAATRS